MLTPATLRRGDHLVLAAGGLTSAVDVRHRDRAA
jgi:hypothetical protein